MNMKKVFMVMVVILMINIVVLARPKGIDNPSERVHHPVLYMK